MILFLLFLTLTSCGYHFENSSALVPYHSISVPFVEGDSDGSLTSAIVSEISKSFPLPIHKEQETRSTS